MPTASTTVARFRCRLANASHVLAVPCSVAILEAFADVEVAR
jgi:hypothetical protein